MSELPCMTVRELVDHLQKYDQDSKVVGWLPGSRLPVAMTMWHPASRTVLLEMNVEPGSALDFL